MSYAEWEQDYFPVEVDITMDPVSMNISYMSLSNGDKTVTHIASVTYASVFLGSKYLIGTDVNMIYWEVEQVHINSVSYFQTIGFAKTSVSTASRTPGDVSTYVYSGNGGIFEGSNINAVGIQTFLDAGDVIQIAANISTGEVWFGLNGTWISDPTVDPADLVIPNGEEVSMYINLRHTSSATSRTLASEFSYPIPTGFVSAALGEFDIDLDGSVTVTNDRTASAGVASWESVIATFPISRYKAQFEVNITSGTNFYIGILGENDKDLTIAANGVNSPVGSVAEGYTYRNNGDYYESGVFHLSAGGSPAFGTAYGAGDTITVAIHMVHETITFYKNGIEVGSNSFSKGAIDWFAAVSMMDTDGEITINGDTETMAYPVEGYDGYFLGSSTNHLLATTLNEGKSVDNWQSYWIPLRSKYNTSIRGSGWTEYSISSMSYGVNPLERESFKAEFANDFERFKYWADFYGVGSISGDITNGANPIAATVKLFDQITDRLIGVAYSTSYYFKNLDTSRKFYIIAQSREDVDLPPYIAYDIFPS